MDTDDTLSRWLDDAVEENAHHHALLALLAETSRVLGADLDLPTLLVKLMALAEKMVGGAHTGEAFNFSSASAAVAAHSQL